MVDIVIALKESDVKGETDKVLGNKTFCSIPIDNTNCCYLDRLDP